MHVCTFGTRDINNIAMFLEMTKKGQSRERKRETVKEKEEDKHKYRKQFIENSRNEKNSEIIIRNRLVVRNAYKTSYRINRLLY